MDTREPTSAILVGWIASRGSVSEYDSGRSRSEEIAGCLAPAVVDQVQVVVESKLNLECARRAWLLPPRLHLRSVAKRPHFASNRSFGDLESVRGAVLLPAQAR